MTREEAIYLLNNLRAFAEEDDDPAIDMAIEALSAETAQCCDGCRYDTPVPQEQCLRCKRYWRDNYEHEGGDME